MRRTRWRERERRAATDPKNYTVLPGRVDPEQLVTTEPVEAAPDPEGGRDTEREFIIRYGAGF